MLLQHFRLPEAESGRRSQQLPRASLFSTEPLPVPDALEREQQQQEFVLLQQQIFDSAAAEGELTLALAVGIGKPNAAPR